MSESRLGQCHCITACRLTSSWPSARRDSLEVRVLDGCTFQVRLAPFDAIFAVWRCRRCQNSSGRTHTCCFRADPCRMTLSRRPPRAIPFPSRAVVAIFFTVSQLTELSVHLEGISASRMSVPMRRRSRGAGRRAMGSDRHTSRSGTVTRVGAWRNIASDV